VTDYDPYSKSGKQYSLRSSTITLSKLAALALHLKYKSNKMTNISPKMSRHVQLDE